MENLKVNTLLQKVSFPVYHLDEKPVEENGVLYLLFKNKELHIIDDKNIEEATLGLRRLNIKANNPEVKLYKLTKAIYFIGDLIKYTKSKQWYIDSLGYCFLYEKTALVPLVYLPIEKIIPIKTGGAIVTVKTLPQRFKCLYTPKNVSYAGLLKISNSQYILYGLVNKKEKNSWRKI